MFRFVSVFMSFFMGILIFAGCDRTDRMMDVTPVAPPPDATVSNMPGTPVKIVTLTDAPEGGKDAYLQWVASIAPTLQAPKEVLRIRSYENVEADVSPHYLVEFDFRSFIDAATYLNRPEIAAIFEDRPNYAPQGILYTFIQRSSWRSNEDTDNAPVKGLLLINYRLGGRDAYLQWAASVAETLIAQPQLKALATYENYYGQPPHRLVEGEFASQEEADAYNAVEEIQAVQAELDIHAASWVEHRFQLFSEYINTADRDQ